MAYFGIQILENDKALDWIDALPTRSPAKRVERALSDYIDWKRGNEAPLSQSDIDRLVDYAIQHDRKYPLSHWKNSNRQIEEWIQDDARKYREELEAGKYLDEEYGPAEEALAAAYLVRAWGFAQERGEISTIEECESHLRTLSKKPLRSDLLNLAISAVEKALASEHYRRMRKFYLEAFPAVSGDDDQMRTVNELLHDLIVLSGKTSCA